MRVTQFYGSDACFGLVVPVARLEDRLASLAGHGEVIAASDVMRWPSPNTRSLSTSACSYRGSRLWLPGVLAPNDRQLGCHEAWRLLACACFFWLGNGLSPGDELVSLEPSEIRTAEVRADMVRSMKVGLVEICVGEVRAAKVRVGEVRAA